MKLSHLLFILCGLTVTYFVQPAQSVDSVSLSELIQTAQSVTNQEAYQSAMKPFRSIFRTTILREPAHIILKVAKEVNGEGRLELTSIGGNNLKPESKK